MPLARLLRPAPGLVPWAKELGTRLPAVAVPVPLGLGCRPAGWLPRLLAPSREALASRSMVARLALWPPPRVAALVGVLGNEHSAVAEYKSGCCSRLLRHPTGRAGKLGPHAGKFGPEGAGTRARSMPGLC